MQTRGSPFRVAMTVLLMVTIPFCCCSFRLLLGGCTPSGATGQTSASIGSAAPVQHHCRRCQPAGVSVDGPGEQPAPTNPDPEQDCGCGKHQGRMLTVHKTTVDLPTPIAIAVLNWTLAPEFVPAGVRFRSPRAESPAVRPPTSLLRLHCALIV